MSTRLYLRHRLATVIGRPAASEATDETDRGDVGAERFLCRVISLRKPPSGGDYTVEWTDTTPPYPATSMQLVALFLGPALRAQTLNAGGTITIAEAITEKGDIPGGIYAAAFAYIWRSGVGYVATISNADKTHRAAIVGGTELAGIDPPPVWREMSAVLGDSIDIQQGDRIACEYWARIESNIAGDWKRVRWNGNQVYTEGQAAIDPACCIETSQNLDMEGTMDAGNILVGARDIDVDESNVGALDGGVEYNPEMGLIEHEVDQRLEIVGADKIRERVTVTCTMKEATLENLRIAMAQPSVQLSDTADTDTLNFGGQRTLPTHEVSITGKAPGTDRTRTLFLRKAVVIESGRHAYQKGAATLYPVTFLCLADLTKAEGFRYGYFEDEDGVFAFA